MNFLLEQSVLYAVSQGAVPLDSIMPHAKLFSKGGKVVAKALEWLTKKGTKPPYTSDSLLLVCTADLGADTDEMQAYIQEMMTHVVGQEIETVFQSALDKVKLLDIQKSVLDQLKESTFDPSAFQTIIQSNGHAKLDNLAEMMKKEDSEHGTAPIPLGEELRSIQEETGGLQGTWVVGGEPGAGKSTLAWQVGLCAAESRPVLFYDMENTARVLYRRTTEMFGGDRGAADQALRRVFVRSDAHAVFREIQSFGEPTFIVVDSLQKLPLFTKGKQENIESWLAKLDHLKHEGHHILLVSQLARGSENYKWTNDIEHTADFGIRMESPLDNPLMSKVYVKKNRHGIKRGFLCLLYRERNWVLTEQ